MTAPVPDAPVPDAPVPDAPVPVLDVRAPAGPTRALALVLHGGREIGTGPVRATQLAVLRMTPFALALRRHGHRHGLAVARLQYLVRGWNGPNQSPLHDVRWALDRLTPRFPGVPIALVGHSMGGRAAIFAAGHDEVRAVVGLAPWVEPDDPYLQVAGRHVLVAHGTADRVTSPARSSQWTRAASDVAASAAYVAVERERHAMIRRAGFWHSLTTDYVLSRLCGVAPATPVVSDILAGRVSLAV